MFRYISRFVGLLFLLAGIGIGLVDGTRSIAADALDYTSLGGALNWLFPNRMVAVQEAIIKNIHPFLWDPVLSTLLPLPAIIPFFATGIVFLIMARDKLRG